LAWANTRSWSSHNEPAAMRSSSWVARCNRRASTSGVGSATVRRLRSAFGSS
jgi:hypothetical protein